MPPEPDEPISASNLPVPLGGPDRSRDSLRIPRSDAFHRVDPEWADRTPLRPAVPPSIPSTAALLRALWQRRVVALTVGIVLGVVAATATWFLRPAQYTAFAVLRIAAAEPQLVPVDRSGTDFKTYQQIQVALLKSSPVLQAALRQEQVRDLSLVRAQPDPLRWLEAEISCSFLEGTEFFRIALSGQEPVELAILVNAVKDAYLREVVQVDHQQRQVRLNELERVCAGLEDRIRSQRDTLRRLAETLKTSDSQALTLKQKIALEEYAALKRDLALVQSELRKAQVELAVQKANSRSAGALEIPDFLVDQFLEADPVVQQQQREVARLEALIREHKRVSANPGPGLARHSRDLHAAKDALEERRRELRPLARERVRQALRTDSGARMVQSQERIAVLQGQREAMQAEVASQGREVEQLGTTSTELEFKRKEIEQTENLIQTLRAEKERLQVEVQSTLRRVTELQPAEVPQSKNTRAQITATVLAGTAAFLVGVLGVCVWECRAGRIYGQEEVSGDLGLRVVGTLPALPHDPWFGRSGSLNPRDRYWNNALMEAINALRTILLREASVEDDRLLMITSAASREGKTLVAGLLATGLARAGHKTLLVEGDLRRPTLHQLFHLPDLPGLSEVLRGEVEPAGVIQPSPMGGLSILPAGQGDVEALHALAHDEVRQLFDRLRKDFDYIVVDSCPLLPVADSLLLGQHVDAVLLVVRPQVSHLAQVYAAYRRLRSARIRVLGTVVNGTHDKFYGHEYPYLMESSEGDIRE